jgi:hypothetical protein
MKHNPIAYRRIAEAARANADGIVRQWLPKGKRIGHEWAALNPRRDDRTLVVSELICAPAPGPISPPTITVAI